jgi:hypothetical protein
MTAAVGQDESTGEALRGLALLRLMAEAADACEADECESQRWVNRRVEQLEFLDVRAVRWRVSVDFEVPETAPVTDVCGQEFRLVPLTSWEKDNLVAFDLRDETGKSLWLPSSAETDHLLSSALICWAGTILGKSPAKMPRRLKETLRGIVSERPPRKERKERKDEDKCLFAYMTERMTAEHAEDEDEDEDESGRCLRTPNKMRRAGISGYHVMVEPCCEEGAAATMDRLGRVVGPDRAAAACRPAAG